MKFQIETDLTADEFRQLGWQVPAEFLPVAFRVPHYGDFYFINGDVPQIVSYNEKHAPTWPVLIVMSIKDVMSAETDALRENLSEFKFKRKIEVKYNKIDADFEPSNLQL